MALTAVLTGLIGAFSRRYLHREKGFERFFLLLNLFGFGSILIFAAGSFDLLIGGWELVGITSVLLIAFFQERREPVRNAVRVFAIYRACDVGLLVGVFLLHHFVGSATFADLFRGEWPAQQGASLTGAAARRRHTGVSPISSSIARRRGFIATRRGPARLRAPGQSPWPGRSPAPPR